MFVCLTYIMLHMYLGNGMMISDVTNDGESLIKTRAIKV
jgi:hypothetical protein